MTEFGQRQVALVPKLPRLRLAAAALILGAAVAGAAILYSHTFIAGDCGFSICSRPPTAVIKPSWIDPTVLALCLLGVAGAVGLLAAPVRIATAAVILGVALGAAAVVYADYRQAALHCLPRTTVPCAAHITYWRAGWINPTALGIVLVGVAIAAGVLITARR
jgi:hypothetical protein